MREQVTSSDGRAGPAVATVQRTVVVLPERWAGVLPAAAVPALRAAARVLADDHRAGRDRRRHGRAPSRRLERRRSPRGAADHRPGRPPTRAEVSSRLPPGAALLDAVAVMDRLRSPGGLPVGRRADPRVAAAVPGRGVLRALPGDRGRRPGRGPRGARRRAAAGAVPRPGGRRAQRRARSTSTTSRQTSSQSSSAGTRTSSPAASRSTPPSARSTAGRSSSAPRSSASPAWTACRSGSRPSRSRRS